MKANTHINHFTPKIISLRGSSSQKLKIELQKLALPDRQGITFVNYNDILYCKSESNYTTVFLANGNEYIISKCLKEIEKLLIETYFFRVHASYLVNLSYLERIIRHSTWEIIINNKSIPVSRNRLSGLRETLGV